MDAELGHAHLGVEGRVVGSKGLSLRIDEVPEQPTSDLARL